ncbi:ras-related protein Rap-2a-like [Haliotis asinina]|uniref:ras-related protein Rap-2a-like n=1 Tax=Haliotis asinina TaxID=109174 RepID=UPI003531F626
MYETFDYRYKPTIEDHLHLDITLPDGERLVLNMVDTSGTDEFPVMRDLRIHQAEVFVVVYALDNQESFQYAIRMCHKIKEIKEVPFENSFEPLDMEVSPSSQDTRSSLTPSHSHGRSPVEAP